jgi:hypothetical protein
MIYSMCVCYILVFNFTCNITNRVYSENECKPVPKETAAAAAAEALVSYDEAIRHVLRPVWMAVRSSYLLEASFMFANMVCSLPSSICYSL